MAHYGVRCDGCSARDFTGVRYKCQHCNDYDLCHNCMINGVTSKQHLTSHPMKSIIAQGDLDLYFGESLRKKERVHDEDDEDEEEYEEEVPEEEEDDEDQISPRDVLGTGEKTYTCPYCARIGYTDELLVNHVVTDHAEEDKPVVCPICAARPGGDPNYISRDFHGHIDLRHGGNRAKKEKSKGKGKGKKKVSQGRGHSLRQSEASELGLSAEKSRRDKRGRKKGDFEGPLYEQEKPEPTPEEKEAAYHSHMMRAIFMQQIILSTLLSKDS